VSNTIRYDALLVHYLARELDQRLRARRLGGVRFDSDARRFILEMDDHLLVWELHPARGWIRVVQSDGAGEVQEVVEGWGGRRIRTQRRPRVRRVSAPPDERWIEIEIDAGGPERASRFVIELMGNQWNVLALAPDRTILSALRTRDAGGRSLRAGAPYQPPGHGAAPAGSASGSTSGPASGAGAGHRREGTEQPIAVERWRQLLGDLEPGERERALVRDVAWTSSINAPAILEAPDLDAAWERYAGLARRPEPDPRVLELARPTPYPLPLPGVPGEAAHSLLAALETAAGQEARATVAPEVRAALEGQLERVSRRAERLRAEVEDAPGKAASLRRRADLLMAQLHRVPKGAERAELDDFEGGTVVAELDPTLGPVDNAQALYDRARKRERAAARLPERVRDAVAEANRLAALLESLDRGDADAEEAARWVARTRPTAGPSGAAQERLPYRSFRSSGGLEIRVGRTGRANDDLTFRHAAPDDIWLHARDAAGAHVILRWSDRDHPPPRRDLLEAAVLAALNSRARTSGTVPVDWTRRKHVRKPRKAAPGAVLPDRVATLMVEPDPSLPDRLSE
jgi:hypothetical protein